MFKQFSGCAGGACPLGDGAQRRDVMGRLLSECRSAPKTASPPASRRKGNRRNPARRGPSQSRQLQREHFILKMLYQVRVNSFAQCIRNVNLVALLRGVASASSHLQYMAFQTSPALGAAPYANNAATRTGSKPPWTTMGSEEALSLIMFIVLPRTIRASSSSNSRGGRRTLTVSLEGGGLWDAST